MHVCWRRQFFNHLSSSGNRDRDRQRERIGPTVERPMNANKQCVEAICDAICDAIHDKSVCKRKQARSLESKSMDDLPSLAYEYAEKYYGMNQINLTSNKNSILSPSFIEWKN
mmetsp:Transcript_6445/g.7410  ORF Transcript_6445/g.7410 Transcript_6445/m.7410 type:complete len:113 (+) Transcript_6445:31-369(+)